MGTLDIILYKVMLNQVYCILLFFQQKRGKRKGLIPLSSVKAVEFVDNTAFDHDKKYCFQVRTRYMYSI